MKLLILFHALIYQALLAKGIEEIVASPEEIARREPDGDHILQEESQSQASQVLLPPDGEVTAAAVRRAEALKYPSRKPDKFRELMEETDIREIHRIIVPPLPNNNTSTVIQNNTNNDAKRPDVFVKVLNPDNREIQTFIRNALPKKEADVILQRPTQPNIPTSSNLAVTRGQQQEERNINTQLPSNREIKFDMKIEKVDPESTVKTSNVHSIIDKQSVQNVVLLRESDSVKNTDHKTTPSNTVGEHDETVIVSNPATLITNRFNSSDLETTTLVNEQIFSFQNQPIVVQDIPELIKKPSVELEAPISKPSLDLEAPFENTEQITEVLVDQTNFKLTTELSSTRLVNEETENQNAVFPTTTVRVPTQGESIFDKITLSNRNSANIEGVSITSPGQTEDRKSTENTNAQTYQTSTGLNYEKEITSVKSFQQKLEVLKIPSLELELPKLDNESEQEGEIGIKGPHDLINNVRQTDSKVETPLFVKKEPQNVGIEHESNDDQRQSESELKQIDNLNKPLHIETSNKLNKIPNEQTHESTQRTIILSESSDAKTKQKYLENKEINVDNIRETSEIPNEKRILSPDAINTPTQNQKGLRNIQTTTSDQRQAILGNAINNNNVIYSKDNANSQYNEKERKEALDFIKDHPLCAQALKYMELSRPQLLFQIYISMAPFFDGISKALHTGPGYAQSYTNYYQHEPHARDARQHYTRNHDTPQIREQPETELFPALGNVRISRQNLENDDSDHSQPKRRCVKFATQNQEETLTNAMPIAEALYNRQNILEESRTV